MKNFLKNFVRDESGASAAEYVLILAIVGSGIAAGALILGQSIDGALQDAAGYIDENNISNVGGGGGEEG